MNIRKHLLDELFWICAILILFKNESKDGVFFLDVGQGDSILIQNGNIQVLIDGGEDNSVLYQVSKYMPLGDMKIELVVLTHPHSDHLDGLFYIFEKYDVDNVWFNDISYKSEIYEYFLSLDIPKEDVKDGMMYILGEWKLSVLASPDDIYKSDLNINNASVVLQLNTDKEKYLFMGDAEVEEERYLIGKGVLEDVNIMKAGHHCSRTASTDKFLDIVKPEIVICSCGKDNKFGHPHKETLEKFRVRNILVYSTMEEGNIQVL